MRYLNRILVTFEIEIGVFFYFVQVKKFPVLQT